MDLQLTGLRQGIPVIMGAAEDSTDCQFFEETLPQVLSGDNSDVVAFTPHLAGDRTSIRNKARILFGLTLGTTREHILCGVVQGIIKQLQDGHDYLPKDQQAQQDDLLHGRRFQCTEKL